MIGSARRRLLVGAAVAAGILVGGRAASGLYADYTWYASQGAAALWNERAGDLLLIYGVGSVVAVLMTFLNLSALGRSIGVLTLPRRLANVEFGEAVPRKYIDRFAIVTSLIVGAALLPALPSWTSLALAKLGASFHESDPYFQHDLAFYTTWLPFEQAAYTWTMLLVVGVSVLVIVLYSLTPGLRWERAGLRMSVRVRRHLSVLAALLLLLTMWSYRLESYELLVNGSGEQGAFSYVDHQWMLSGLLILSIATAAAAITVLLSGWMGQLRTSFIAVTVIVMLSVTIQEIVPLIVRRFTPGDAQILQERPYLATRTDYTLRAYAPDAASYEAQRKSGVSAALDSVVTNAASQQMLRQDSLSYPGAHGLALVSEPLMDVAGQPLGDGLSRLGYAWAYQSFNLLSDSVPRRARIVTVRDVRNRVRALAPIFAQGTIVEPMFHADTLYWKLELYTASNTFPLSKHFTLAGEERSYFRHAATALVNARTARVFTAADPSPDPIASAWMARFPNAAEYRAPGIAKELTSAPWSPVSPGTNLPASDAPFRDSVARLYNRMRAALAATDLKSFGAAFDSLGLIIGQHQR